METIQEGLEDTHLHLLTQLTWPHPANQQHLLLIQREGWVVFQCDASHAELLETLLSHPLTNKPQGQSPAPPSSSGKRIYFSGWESVRVEAFHTPKGRGHA